MGFPGISVPPLHPVLRLFHTVDGLSTGYGKNFCNFSGNFPKNSPLNCTVFQHKSRRQILCCLPPPRHSLSISFDNSQIFSIIVWESFCLKNDVLPGFSPRRNGLFRPVSGAVPPPGAPLPSAFRRRSPKDREGAHSFRGGSPSGGPPLAVSFPVFSPPYSRKAPGRRPLRSAGSPLFRPPDGP